VHEERKDGMHGPGNHKMENGEVILISTFVCFCFFVTVVRGASVVSLLYPRKEAAFIHSCMAYGFLPAFLAFCMLWCGCGKGVGGRI
jgi:hypothetical protein